MANVLSDEKKHQVLALGRLHWSLRRIENATGIRRETASGYLRAAGIVIREPGRWGHGGSKPAGSNPANEAIGVITDCGAENSNPANEVITDFVAEIAPTPSSSDCESHREVIEVAHRAGRNAMSIYQQLVDDHGFTSGYSSVMRFVRKLRGDASGPEARAVIHTAPGEEAQVDYGEGPMVRDPETGKYRRTRLFVLTLGFSRKSVRLLTFRSSAKIWSELHERSFRRLGGAPRIIVLDNLREGVLRPDVHDPAINPLYRDVLAHYGVVAMPARVRDPDRKGKVEAGVAHAQKTPLRGMRFETIAAAQEHLDRWEARWADTRIHGTRKKQVAAMFAEERPSLMALPIEPFRYYNFGQRSVHLDGHVEVGGAYYSVPPGQIGKRLPVQWDDHRVRILDARTGQLLREHLVQTKGRHRTQEQDRPRRAPPTTERLLARMRAIGKNIGALSLEIHARDGELAVRRVLGVLALARKHGAPAVDEACSVALEMGVPTYRCVRRYVERQEERVSLTLRQVDPLIRELSHYRDVIARRTETRTE